MTEFLYLLIIDYRSDPPSEHFYVKKHALFMTADLPAYFSNMGVTNLKSFRVWFASMHFSQERFDSAPLYIEDNTKHCLIRVCIQQGDKITMDELFWNSITLRK